MGPSVITLPERLDPRSVEAMRTQLSAAADSSAIIFQGIPNRFCLGMDFVSSAGPGMAGSKQLHQNLNYFASFMEEVLTAPRPTLAVIDGPAAEPERTELRVGDQAVLLRGQIADRAV